MPRTRTVMRRIKEVLRLKFELELNDSQVATGARLARSTVQDALHRIAATGLEAAQLCALTDEELDRRLFPPREARNPGRPLPDWEALDRESRRRGVTLRLLWLECIAGQPDGYQYAQFLLHAVPASFPGLAAGVAPDGDAAGAPRRRGARSRLCRDDADGDGHGRAPRGAGVRGLPAVLEPGPRRGELDARA